MDYYKKVRAIVFGFIALSIFTSCAGKQHSVKMDEQEVREEIQKMLNDYFSDVNAEGLMAEFKYLDDSPDFFWNPPGYNSALPYDSVKAEVERNARKFQSARFRWDTLRVYPLTNDIAEYSGIVSGTMTDTSGATTKVRLKESGTVIRKSSGWKILNGHTTLLDSKTEHYATQKNQNQSMERVTGIGGIFFKAENPKKIKEWYNEHLGLNTDQWGTNFEWRQADEPSQKGFTQWSPFKESTTYFEPSGKDFMINYRVENIERLVDQLRKEGITVLDEIETFDYGKFVHILDPEGNKIELWEPNDVEYDKIVEGRTK